MEMSKKSLRDERLKDTTQMLGLSSKFFRIPNGYKCMRGTREKI